MEFTFVNPRSNFALYLEEDGGFTTRSDLVAQARWEGKHMRFVIPHGAHKLKKARPGRARADLLMQVLKTSGLPRKDVDAVYVAALRHDNAKRVAITEKLLWMRRAIRFAG